MIIHSKFHDYYDGAAGYGIDTDLRYIRTTKEIENRPGAPKFANFNGLATVQSFVVYFCGKVYPGLKFFQYDGDAEKVYYSIDELPSGWRRRINTYCDRDALKNHFSPTNYDHELNITLESPIIVDTAGIIRSDLNKTIINPLLADYKFFQVVDTFAAFQEISMYLGGILTRPGSETVVLTDGSRVAKHGFDRWSFRKPGKRGMY